MIAAARATKASSDGNIDFLKKVSGPCTSSVVFLTVVLFVLNAMFVSKIVMGALYLDDCDAEEMIPIYLLVAGICNSLRTLYTVYKRWKHETEWTKFDNVMTVYDLFLVAWFVAGCVYIYRTKGDFQSHSKNLPEYCDYTLYWFSFWITTSAFILIGVVLILLLVVLLFAISL